LKFLFIHKDFPGQFRHIVRHLANMGDQVVGIGQHCEAGFESIRFYPYNASSFRSLAHPLAQEFDLAVQVGRSVADLCHNLKESGFTPDVVVGHTGWGETLFVKDVWPAIPLLGYFEFYYHFHGSDIDFDPEFPPSAELAMRLRTRNAINLVALAGADRGLTPTRWQQQRYPARYQDRLSVIHEGIDTDLVRPNPSARLHLAGGLSLGTRDTTITFCARSLEPYRGFHIFMRALPRILQRLPKARVLIVGADDQVSYGPAPEGGSSWRERLTAELKGSMDFDRVHFLGWLPYRSYLTVLQISTVHVYLTYPFILSWSLLEALSAGCLVVGSRTGPVEEIITEGANGYLVDFFDVEALAARIVAAVETRDQHRLRTAARTSVIKRFDLSHVCLPAYLAILRGMGATIAAT
jgi:glycosyltransferase involved in cell wall biosynthesis